MKKTFFLRLLVTILLVTIVIISGCNTSKEESYKSNDGSSCVQHSECKLPMDYAVQSNCPFGTSCIDSECKVICPLTYHDPNPEISKSYSFTCEIDSDCDCTEREKRTIKCLCVDNNCVSVEAE